MLLPPVGAEHDETVAVAQVSERGLAGPSGLPPGVREQQRGDRTPARGAQPAAGQLDDRAIEGRRDPLHDRGEGLPVAESPDRVVAGHGPSTERQREPVTRVLGSCTEQNGDRL